MDIRMTIDWDSDTDISGEDVLKLLDAIEVFFNDKDYGQSVSCIWVVVICRPYDFKQRKRFKKDAKRLEYDILLDYFLIKNITLNEKKAVIRKQIIEITQVTVNKYKFDDFDRAAFLTDFELIVNQAEW